MGRTTLVAGVATFAAHWVVVLVALAQGYGWHRDEFYYFQCGQHLALGYVDHPLLAPLLARGVQEVFGADLVVLRLIAGLCHAVVVGCACQLARDMNGGVWAERIAGLAVFGAPVLLGATSMFGATALDLAMWALLWLCAVRLRREATLKLWVFTGLVLGLGLLSKVSIVLFAVSLCLASVLTDSRPVLRGRGPMLAVGLVVLFAAPFVVWQATHGFPFQEFSESVRQGTRDEGVGSFLVGQLGMGPMALLLLALATWAFWKRTMPKEDRFVLVTCLIGFVLAILAGGKPYYVAALYLGPIAIGARVLERRWSAGRALEAVFAGCAGAGLCVGAPVLPPLTYKELGLSDLNDVPAEMLGWDELVSAVDAASKEHSVADVWALNYGVAGAVQLKGEPGTRIWCAHNSYWFWSPPPTPLERVLFVAHRSSFLQARFRSVRLLRRVSNRHGVPNEESGVGIFLCEHPTGPTATLWSDLRSFN
jgi:hypothetical protein